MRPISESIRRPSIRRNGFPESPAITPRTGCRQSSPSPSRGVGAPSLCPLTASSSRRRSHPISPISGSLRPAKPGARIPELDAVYRRRSGAPSTAGARSELAPDSIRRDAQVWRKVWKPTPSRSARLAAGNKTRPRRLPGSAERRRGQERPGRRLSRPAADESEAP